MVNLVNSAVQLPETGLSKSGPELLDDVQGQIFASQLVNFGLLRGSVALSDLSTFGDGAEGLARFSPGVDQSSMLDVPRSLSGNGVFARRPVSNVEVPSIVVLADVPKRLENTTGRASLFDVARYGTALCAAVAAKANAPLKVVLTTESESELVLDSASARDGYIAMQALDERRTLGVEKKTHNNGLLQGLAHVGDMVNIHEDVLFVMSDLRAGYQPEGGMFDWEESLKNLHNNLGDRLMIGWLNSPAQQRLPMGVSNRLGIDETIEVRRRFIDTARRKQERIRDVLQSMRFAEIDTSLDQSIKLQLSDFILAKP